MRLHRMSMAEIGKIIWRLNICLLVVLIMLTSLAARSESVHFSNQAATRTASSEKSPIRKTAAVSLLGCPDYNNIYGSNYYTQLTISWTSWSTTGAISSSAVVNYLYNLNAQESYNLYLASMQAKSCPAQISAPTALTPSSIPSSTFVPPIANVTPGCNAALAVQYVGIYNDQLNADLNQEQKNLDAWINTQPASISGITPKLASGVATIETQLNTQVRLLMIKLLNATSTLNCG